MFKNYEDNQGLIKREKGNLRMMRKGKSVE